MDYGSGIESSDVFAYEKKHETLSGLLICGFLLLRAEK